MPATTTGRHLPKATAPSTRCTAPSTALADVLGGHPRLLAYDVHALAEGPDAEGRVTVTIAPPASAEPAPALTGRYTGEVTSTNIIAASIEAYLQALNAMLVDEAWAGATEEADRGPDPVAQRRDRR